MGKYYFVVVSNPVAGKEDEYNKWYNEQHLSDVLKVPGFVAAQRFKATQDGGLPGRYVAIYEMEADDPQTVLTELGRRSGTPDLVMSDAIDLNNISATLCVAASPRMTAKTR